MSNIQPKFKIGDIVKDSNAIFYKIISIVETTGGLPLYYLGGGIIKDENQLHA